MFKASIKLMLTAFVFVSGLVAFEALAMSDAEVADAYNGCMSFLVLNPAKQAEVAKRTGTTLQQVLDACNLMKRNGLKESQRLEREYQAAQRRARAPRSDSGSSGAASGTCYALPNCSGDETYTSIKFSCPPGTMSFRADQPGYGCEQY